jgi:hypothetical protein
LLGSDASGYAFTSLLPTTQAVRPNGASQTGNMLKVFWRGRHRAPAHSDTFVPVVVRGTESPPVADK